MVFLYPASSHAVWRRARRVIRGAVPESCDDVWAGKGIKCLSAPLPSVGLLMAMSLHFLGGPMTFEPAHAALAGAPATPKCSGALFPGAHIGLEDSAQRSGDPSGSSASLRHGCQPPECFPAGPGGRSEGTLADVRQGYTLVSPNRPGRDLHALTRVGLVKLTSAVAC